MASVGPCVTWVTGADVVVCCSTAADDVGTFSSLVDDAAQAASEILYELSGRRWAGLCTREGVRPCHTDCLCGWQVLSRGHLVPPAPYLDSWDCLGAACGCRSMSRVKLSGYVQEITEVKIDGLVVDPSVYRLDEHRWLTRVDGSRWPSCSRADLPDTEEGTFSVSYIFGREIPQMAFDAAVELACQVYAQCSGSESGDCALPKGVTRITRQGITIERGVFAFNRAAKSWQTGMPSVDFFLNAVNPHGLLRRALFFGPGSRNRYARPVG